MILEPIEERLRKLEAKGTAEGEKLGLAQHDARETAESRRFITRFVLYLFAVALGAYAAAALAGFGAANALLEIIKVGILPLVTLVLGFYLSRAR